MPDVTIMYPIISIHYTVSPFNEIVNENGTVHCDWITAYQQSDSESNPSKLIKFIKLKQGCLLQSQNTPLHAFCRNMLQLHRQRYSYSTLCLEDHQLQQFSLYILQEAFCAASPNPMLEGPAAQDCHEGLSISEPIGVFCQSGI